MVPRSGVLFLRRQKQVRSLLTLHSAMSGTEVSADNADKISQSVADNPLFFVDGAGDTVFGRSAAYTWHSMADDTLATHKLTPALVCKGGTG